MSLAILKSACLRSAAPEHAHVRRLARPAVRRWHRFDEFGLVRRSRSCCCSCSGLRSGIQAIKHDHLSPKPADQKCPPSGAAIVTPMPATKKVSDPQYSLPRWNITAS